MKINVHKNAHYLNNNWIIENSDDLRGIIEDIIHIVPVASHKMSE